MDQNKKAPAVPHWDGEALAARFHSPVSLREASIAAQTAGIAPPTPGRTFPPPPGGPLAAGGGPSLSVEQRYSSRSSWLYLYYITSAPHLCQGRGGIFPRLPQNAFTCGKPYGAGGARGGEARLESNQMPRKARTFPLYGSGKVTAFADCPKSPVGLLGQSGAGHRPAP